MRIRSQLQMAGSKGVIYLYDVITAGKQGIGISAAQVAQWLGELRTAGTTQLDVRINSPGGDVFEGYAIYNLLRAWQGTLTVYVDGIAASIASVIALAADTRVIHDLGMVMVHRSWTDGRGNADDLESAAGTLRKIDEQITQLLHERTGKTRARIEKLLEGEGTWLSALEAIDLGFATEQREYDLTDSVVGDSVERQWMSSVQSHPQAALLLRRVAAEYTRSGGGKMDLEMLGKLAADSAKQAADAACAVMRSELHAEVESLRKSQVVAQMPGSIEGAPAITKYNAPKALIEREKRSTARRLAEYKGVEPAGVDAAFFAMAKVLQFSRGGDLCQALADGGFPAAAARLDSFRDVTTTGTAGTGGNYCPIDVQLDYIKSLEEQAQIGALIPAVNRIKSMREAVSIPVATGGVTASWTGRGVAPTASDPTDALMLLKAHRYSAEVVIEKAWLTEAAIQNPEMMIRELLALRGAQLEDVAILSGKGTTYEPSGLEVISAAHATAASSVADYAGVHDDLVDMDARLDGHNVPGDRVYIFPRTIRGYLRKKGTALGVYPYDLELKSKELEGQPVVFCGLSGAPTTKGFLVSPSEMVLFDHLALEFQVSNQTGASTNLDPIGQIAIRVFREMDFNLKHAVSCDIITTLGNWS